MDLYLMVAEGGALMDLQKGRIDNRWSLLGLCTGFFVHFLRDGPKGLKEGLLGALLPLLLLFPLFLVHGLGAGDIKLLCALGSFLNCSGCFTLLILSLLMGGIFSVVILLHSGNIRRPIHQFSLFLYGLFSHGPSLFTGESANQSSKRAKTSSSFWRENGKELSPSGMEDAKNNLPLQKEGEYPPQLQRERNISPYRDKRTFPFALSILLGTLFYSGGLSL